MKKFVSLVVAIALGACGNAEAPEAGTTAGGQYEKALERFGSLNYAVVRGTIVETDNGLALRTTEILRAPDSANLPADIPISDSLPVGMDMIIGFTEELGILEMAPADEIL